MVAAFYAITWLRRQGMTPRCVEWETVKEINPAAPASARREAFFGYNFGFRCRIGGKDSKEFYETGLIQAALRGCRTKTEGCEKCR